MTRDDVSENKNSHKSKLIPFLTTTILYFSLIEHTDRATTPSTVLKCMPIISLLFFVMLTETKTKEARRYSRCIWLGLCFSSVGDLLLNYDLFEAGMGAFGAAQVCYIAAFGFRRLKLWIGAILYVGGIMATALFYENLNSIIKICLPMYAVLLLTMCWRSLARIQTPNNLLQLACGISSILFVLSDGIIAFDKFYTPIYSAQTYIMITYYIAQAGITLSITDHRLDEFANTLDSPKQLYKKTASKNKSKSS
ncbi:lysoplasmalogenase-like protein TMEM86A [Anopheles bellator]|uniref:lysoplasmalogenase-like protein TMEM86A n=1 Tax=Anopheles bellator TaxID=139047 RepID=UPI002647E1C6|nr:lysoplasmalogenase-like protein TMEM86A [Anopheles bellator]